ncbi:N-acetyltransferase [Chimaeribacter arupi]|uniref:N-acetyltransferase n=2 Tax=Yersiniaceae TaxID=1903411 RepID=A0A2N5ELE7_9GAMM|nr:MULTISPECIES: N-acetyltransferase [Yersiniaceae]MBS0967895.1 N-acetyltransferase [Nissabacter archeti]MDV5142539.1 N-acetyltransferase [Chimaeribacter arupi]PLR37139.1 N-acetyltransferase [Chimaeribacter arupi]PLR45564.1 N-acetyltransferase [Chimaeribacter arupi]PLR48015.1 N-acetyltransferase [Chimaeribacter arupi]
MIRAFRPADMEPLMALWLASTIAGHPFIEARYWHESAPLVREAYLPRADTWVDERDGGLAGFISVMDGRFVGALFVAPARFGTGVADGLMAWVQQRFPLLSLEVYMRNHRAVAFYRKWGFVPQRKLRHRDTHAMTLIMAWKAQP